MSSDDVYFIWGLWKPKVVCVCCHTDSLCVRQHRSDCDILADCPGAQFIIKTLFFPEEMELHDWATQFSFHPLTP